MESRLRIVRKQLNLTQEALAKKLGIGKSALSMIETGKAALSERNKNILEKTLRINGEWLDTGKGDMFLEYTEEHELYDDTDLIPTTRVPLYDIERNIGLAELFKESHTIKPISYIRIPHLPNCDGALSVYVEGMYPLLKSGDIVLYKKLSDINNIFWGDMYLLSLDIDGEEYITVRYIQQSTKPGYIILASYGDNNTDQEVEISKITAIAFVKATIRINAIR